MNVLNDFSRFLLLVFAAAIIWKFVTSRGPLRVRFHRTISSVFNKRLVFILLGLVFALEALNHFAPAFEGKRFRNENFHDPNAMHILCIGDSFTEGYGAVPGGSYPESLERILDSSMDTVEVANWGNAGSNMTEIRQRLQRSFEKLSIAPDVILVQGGLNNEWNLNGFSEYARENDLTLNSIETLQLRLSNSGTFRLLFNFCFLHALSSNVLSDEVVSDWLVNELEQMNALCRSRQKKMIVVDYPGTFPHWTRIADWAENNNVVSIELPDAPIAPELLGHDGSHLNKAGYYYFAQQVAKSLPAMREEQDPEENE